MMVASSQPSRVVIVSTQGFDLFDAECWKKKYKIKRGIASHLTHLRNSLCHLVWGLDPIFQLNDFLLMDWILFEMRTVRFESLGPTYCIYWRSSTVKTCAKCAAIGSFFFLRSSISSALNPGHLECPAWFLYPLYIFSFFFFWVFLARTKMDMFVCSAGALTFSMLSRRLQYPTAQMTGNCVCAPLLTAQAVYPATYMSVKHKILQIKK